jgi:hypothetical protein
VGSARLPVHASEELVGVWRLVSFVVEDISAKKTRLPYGPRPKGYFIFLPSGRAAVLVTSADRKVPTTAEECGAAFQSMIAFSGKYRAEHGKCIINVDRMSLGSAPSRSDFIDLKVKTCILRGPPGPHQIAQTSPEQSLPGSERRDRDRIT